jgi:hypothetical protein
MLTAIDGVNDDNPCMLVVDLATLAFPKAGIPLLIDHCADLTCLAGAWDDPQVDANGLTAVPRVMPADANGLRPYVADLAGRIVENRLPAQASIGADIDPDRAGSFAPLTAPETINGRQIDPAAFGGLPVIVLRNGLVMEASLVLFGADHRTGAACAALPLDQRLRAALAKYPSHAGLVAQALADGADDAALGERVLGAQLATVTRERDEARAQLAAALARPPAAPVTPPTKTPAPLPGGAATGCGEIDPPATLRAALTRHRDELANLPTPQRIARMRALYPSLTA